MTRNTTTVLAIAGVGAIMGLAAAIVMLQANRAGVSPGELLRVAAGGESRAQPAKPGVLSPAELKSARYLTLLDGEAIGEPMGDSRPWIPGVQIVDLDRDGLLDVLVCDSLRNSVSWIRQSPAGVYTEQVISETIEAPVRTSVADMDGDGDLDVLVAAMGMIFPNNSQIGTVMLLENLGENEFQTGALFSKTSRVTDVQPGDLDGDGDIDLAVGQFGYDNGEVRWLENQGGGAFVPHLLLSLSGTIHTPIADMDGDGDLDIVALVSQEWEEVYIFEGDGRGGFTSRRVYGSSNEHFGSSGIQLTDLDRDGDLDILYTNGDAFDYAPPAPRPWHGVNWLENKGGLVFEFHRIGDFPGAYSPLGVDLDRDGDTDIVVVSSFNTWDHPGAVSMVWFQNDGSQQFAMHPLRIEPTHLLGFDAADMDGDGWVDLVTGGMHAYPPFDRMSRVTLWRNRWSDLQP